MPDTATLTAFVLIVLAAFVIPGPAVMLVLTRAAQGGRKTGILTGLGIAMGDFVHTMFAAVGLSAVLMTSSLAFNLVKLAGAGYLIYLGVRAMLAKPSPSDPSLPKVPPLTPSKAFFQAVVVEMLNPKTALFFLAFLPQFVRPDLGSSFTQFAVLGLIFVAMSLVYTTLLALAVEPLGHFFKRLSWLRRWQVKFSGPFSSRWGLRSPFRNNRDFVLTTLAGGLFTSFNLNHVHPRRLPGSMENL